MDDGAAPTTSLSFVDDSSKVAGCVCLNSRTRSPHHSAFAGPLSPTAYRQSSDRLSANAGPFWKRGCEDRASTSRPFTHRPIPTKRLIKAISVEAKNRELKLACFREKGDDDERSDGAVRRDERLKREQSRRTLRGRWIDSATSRKSPIGKHTSLHQRSVVVRNVPAAPRGTGRCPRHSG